MYTFLTFKNFHLVNKKNSANKFFLILLSGILTSFWYLCGEFVKRITFFKRYVGAGGLYREWKLGGYMKLLNLACLILLLNVVI